MSRIFWIFFQSFFYKNSPARMDEENEVFIQICMDILSNEQMTILRFLYENSDEEFNINALLQQGIEVTHGKLHGLSVNGLIRLDYRNKDINSFSITSFGQAYYEQHQKLLAEEKRHKEYEDKILAVSEKSNAIAEDANNISKTANKYSIVAFIVSMISAAATVASVIVMLLKS